jgi:hypothetical protein
MNKISRRVVSVKVEWLRERTTFVKMEELGKGTTSIGLE